MTTPLGAEKETGSKSTATKVESVSCGSVNRGGLGHAAELPIEGESWMIPSPWRERDRRYGTDELVGLIERSAKSVNKAHPGAVLGVADLSRKQGGAIPEHVSHQSGRDVDLIYYAKSAPGDDGKPLGPIDALPYWRKEGHATFTRAPEKKRITTRWFDHERNFALVAALATDSEAAVERIFVSLRIHRWLIAAGEKAGDKEALKAVKAVLRAGNSGEGHNDHLHVRIACSDEDIRVGLCRPYLAPRRKNGQKWRWGIRCPR